ncbi:MAG: hypothetical protein HQK55_02945 [Deltaproteobacteria bacterium]|nr:hypothetical protein [Deltaproteobacteria bacterium]
MTGIPAARKTHCRITALVCLWCLLLFCLWLMATGCQSMPKIINHPAPPLKNDFTPFVETGCDQTGYCKQSSLLATLGCDDIIKPSNELNGLKPSSPMAICLVEEMKMELRKREARKKQSQGLPGEKFAQVSLYRTGCLMASWAGIIIYQDNQFKIIKDKEELRKTFAPLQSPEAALGYAVAATNMIARYGITPTQLQNLDNWQVKEIEDTHVEKVTDGYVVHLFDRDVCGCGPKKQYAVAVQVSESGTIKELSRTVIQETKTEICVD